MARTRGSTVGYGSQWSHADLHENSAINENGVSPPTRHPIAHLFHGFRVFTFHGFPAVTPCRPTGSPARAVLVRPAFSPKLLGILSMLKQGPSASSRAADDPHALDRTAALRLLIVMTRAVRAITAPSRQHLKRWDLSPTEFAALEAL